MCGIFGAVILKTEKFNKKNVTSLLRDLFIFSETRGREAAGIAIRNENNVEILKEALKATNFVNGEKFRKVLKQSLQKVDLNKQSFSFIGHSRLVTNGAQSNNKNNQPLITKNQIGIHNGIITNYSELWKTNKELKKETELDTEILFKLIEKNNSNNNLEKSLRDAFAKIEGTASIASFLRNNSNLILATNTGSIYFHFSKEKQTFIFASEKYILEKILRNKYKNIFFDSNDINQLEAFQAINLDLGLKYLSKISLLSDAEENVNKISLSFIKTIKVIDHSSNLFNLKRCTKCILPETYPYMDFDKQGVCRYCRNYKSLAVNKESELEIILNKYRSNNKKPDCIVALSGGRDSCYGLHYLKKKLGMNPIAFTYDWGFVTDLARRNAARICGKLGIELIIRSPNISAKRSFVRNNVKAWLRKPELGMIPLFMAGDKAFFYHANQLKKQTGIDLVIFCSGNSMENAYYKYGFSEMKRGDDSGTLFELSFGGKISLLKYYLKNFIKNPRYINNSLLDSAAGFFHSYIGISKPLALYKYLPWDENQIVNTIINEYGWETSPETETTWRIGDATAAFYNYIYSTIAGFTEDDDMLSNMVREKYITREEALKRSELFSKPRYSAIKEYLEMINLNYNDTINTINATRKLY